MTVKEYHLYPDYRITEEENKSLKIHEICQLKKERHAAINKALTQLNLRHNSAILSPFQQMRLTRKVHPRGVAGGMSQRYTIRSAKKLNT